CGGASGLGAAVDAAARGYRTLLLEQHDFAKGTSSRSTKLIHGGVRYLKQGNVSLVLESLRERGRLLRNAPHLVHAFPFIVPAHQAWEKLYYGIGLKAYDWLSGRWSLGPSQIISRAEMLEHLPTIAPELRGGVRYFDGQFDDSRLAICLAQTLCDLGGTALNYTRVTRFVKDNDRITGVVAHELESGAEFELGARVVINATGVFTDAVRRLDDPATVTLVTASQGAHIVVERSFLPGDSALMVPKTTDGRVLFAIPWHEHVVIGTTDSAAKDLSLEPRPLADEIEFLIENASRYLARAPGRSDILSAFAGLRPLVKSSAQSTAKLSRDHTIEISRSSLVTLTGGKWTTYRKMGEDVVDHAAKIGGLEPRPSRTAERSLHGAVQMKAATAPAHWRVYGSDSEQLLQWTKMNHDWNATLHPRLPYLAVEVVWAVRQEMARTIEDVLARRTRALFLDARASIEMAHHVAAILRAELNRDAGWEREQIASFTQLARGYAPG
ncbi:MAG TPA: glycerol-3-phosphate dehydrogenase/oxidase, partial [Candidatus Limnocylindria bacterium]|nr:glycerol-3-phosphate dehydrogenase/oxidase [Candidatus Limnocylindria bacterium]